MLLRTVRSYRGWRLSSSYGRDRLSCSRRSFWWSSSSSKEKEGEGGDGKDGDVRVTSGGNKGEGGEGSSTVLPEEGGVPKMSHLLPVPVGGRPLFPGFMVPVQISCAETIRAIMELKQKGTPYVGVFMEAEEGSALDENGVISSPIHRKDQIKTIGALAQISNIAVDPSSRRPPHSLIEAGNVVVDNDNDADAESSDGTPQPEEALKMELRMVLLGHQRVRVAGIDVDTNVPRVKVEYLEAESYDRNDSVIRAYTQEMIATMREVIQLNPILREQVQLFAPRYVDVHEPTKLADLAGSLCQAEPEELQALYEELTVHKRLDKALLLLKKERELGKLQQRISKEVEEKMSADQREYLLRAQLKKIKEELGIERDDKDALLRKYREALDRPDISLPKEASKVIDEELEKLASLEKNSAEFNVTRSYLDWLTCLPWGVHSPDVFDVRKAQDILDADHYGMKDVKDRILEFIAVSKLCGQTQGTIMCMVGPPGVGKTSIGKSIAKALDRSFYRFSVGGLGDVSEIKGHRRTYIGAMPGKPIQCLKTCQTSNPLILIDEIDKLGTGRGGDPASALLELLDPNQNDKFQDHYLDVPVDLSKALFVCTANVEDTIPGPLRDRMEMVRLAGYDLPEKQQISRTYLEPKIRDASGLDASRVSLDDDAVVSLIRWYCREAGVRNLEKHLERIYRKVALEIVRRDDDSDGDGNDDAIVIGKDDLASYVGKPPFTSDRLYEDDASMPLGVTTGLAWTSMGGSTLYIECVGAGGGRGGEEEPGKTTTTSAKRLVTTGKLGEVMSESARIAHTYARVKLRDSNPENDFLESGGGEIHLHVPEGATPKDGPSAGVTMVTSLLSLAEGKKVPSDLAMTGELTLTGMVLPVGGIKEKVIAARRSGVKRIVLPEGNRKDFEELPDYLKTDLDVRFAQHYDDVYAAVF